MTKFLFPLITLFLLNSLGAQTDRRLNGIDKELQAILDATQAPGFSVAVVEGDKIVFAKGYGYRDYENKVPADANTLYAIGSTSKAFTSAILGQLRQEDKLSFEDSPIKYIPELRFYNDEMNNGIIIKDLMSHRTGLPRHDFSWYLFPTNDRDSLMLRIAYQEPFTGVRKQWYYNNFMFLAQGVIAEKITGKSWEENIVERFFIPLGMTRSNTRIREMKESSNAALGYELQNDSVISKMDYYDIAAMSPAGSINSSVNDMSKWIRTWINSGKNGDTQIIPESYLKEAISSQMVVSGGFPEEEFPDMHMANYGYGWLLTSYRGHYRVGHGGNIDGFSAGVTFFPTDSLGIVVLTNQNGSALPNLVRNTLADHFLKVGKTDWIKVYRDRKEKAKKEEAEAKVNETSSDIKGTSPSHILQQYTGKYENPGYGSFQIENRNDSLIAVFKLKSFYLNHVHYDVFEPFEIKETGIDTTGIGGLRLNFSTNDGGDISDVKMKVEGTLENPIKFKHTPFTIEVDKATLKTYTGDYELAGTVIKVYTKNEDTLYLFVAGQPEYELLATAKHKFSFKTLEGFKVEFLEAENGAINEVMLVQPNGTFKATKK
jgi:CubicO group peptidase (beta-lactamase class C family)